MSSVVIYVCVHASVCMYAYTYNNKVYEEEVMNLTKGGRVEKDMGWVGGERSKGGNYVNAALIY